MTETKHIKISDYNYPLPDERIAKFPLPVRDQSKLLVYRHGEVSETVFTSLPDYMEPGMLMVSIIQSYSGTPALQKGNRCTDRNILSGTYSAKRLCTQFPADSSCRMVMYDR